MLFVDVLLLASNKDDVEYLEILKVASAYSKCCRRDDNMWSIHMTWFARVYYYKIEDFANTPEFLYGLYEGQIR